MVICGSYMFEFSISKDVKKNNNDKRRIHMKGGGSREDGNTFISNTNCQGIEN